MSRPLMILAAAALGLLGPRTTLAIDCRALGAGSWSSPQFLGNAGPGSLLRLNAKSGDFEIPGVITVRGDGSRRLATYGPEASSHDHLQKGENAIKQVDLSDGSRIAVPVVGSIEGCLVSSTPSLVTLRTISGKDLAIPLEAIETIDISRGRGRRSSAVRGAAVGVVAWMTLALVATEGEVLAGLDGEGARILLTTTATFAMLGAAIGALSGDGKDWQPLESPPPARSVSLSPIVGLADRKAGLAVRFSF